MPIEKVYILHNKSSDNKGDIPDGSSGKLLQNVVWWDIVITRKNRTVILNEVDDVEKSPSLFDKISSILVTPAYAAGKIYHMRADDYQEQEIVGVPSRSYKAWVIYNSRNKKVVTSTGRYAEFSW